MLKKVILLQLPKHLSTNNIIIPQQYGLKEGYFCIHQLLRVTEFAILEHNKNQYTQLILLDIEKSFDALIYKLQNINTPTALVQIIKNYLANRKIFEAMNNSNSSIKTAKTEVSQGSILGPVLYNIYTNDIPTSIKPNWLYMRAT